MHGDLTKSIKQSLASPVLLMNLEEEKDDQRVLLGDAERDDLLNLAHKIKKAASKKHAKLLIL